MHLAFNVLRTNSLKYYASLVDEALARGHDVTLLCDYTETETPRSGGKSYEFPWIEKLPQFSRGRPFVLPYHTPAEFGEAVKRRGVDVVLSIWKSPTLTALRRQYAPSVPIVQIVGGWDYLLVGMDLDLFDAVYGLSANWPGWLAEYTRSGKHRRVEGSDAILAALRKIYVPVGFSEMEQLKVIDRAGARARLGLPPNRPVVLVMPFPFGSVRPAFWSHRVYGAARPTAIAAVVAARRWEFWRHARHGWNDRSLVASLRDFCRRAGALLVVKSRKKNPARRYLARAADRVLYDECYYPATIVDAVVAADLCVTFYSSVIGEAVCAGTPTICIAPTREEWPAYGERMIVPAFSDEPGGCYNYPNAVRRLRVSEAIDTFSRARLDDFPADRAARTGYVDKFFGFTDLDVSGRVLADLHTRFGL